MRTRIIIIIVSFLMLHLACEEKKPITQELCESKTNRADCEAVGCTYMCDMVFFKKLQSSSDCVARRHVSRCLAVVKFVGKDDNTNNGDIDYKIGPNQAGWIQDQYIRTGFVNNDNIEYWSIFKIKNPFPYTVEVLGHQRTFQSDSSFYLNDPCLMFDPDGAPDVLWEGSCETDWWSEAMWDDILAK